MSQFRILSLDGGGIRGAITAGFLAEIERKTGQPIINHFDMIAGTSTGGIIAVALAMGMPAVAIEAFYRDRGAKIFTRPKPVKIGHIKRALFHIGELVLRRQLQNPKLAFDRDWIFQPKYCRHELSKALFNVLGHKTLKEAKRRLVVPAVNLIEGKTVVFKTPHAPGYVRDCDFRAVDVVLATTAAPTYFSPAVIGLGSAYADGGLWANNPAICAYAEAVCISQKCPLPNAERLFGSDDIYMLLVGTGKFPYFLSPADGREGLLHWGSELLNIMGGAQSQGITFQAQYLLGNRLKRVDFELGQRWPLDAVEKIDNFIHLGHAKATEELADIEQRFIGQPALPYTPYVN